MQAIDGKIDAGEASHIQKQIAARQRGPALPFHLLLIGLMIGGMLVGIAVGVGIELIADRRFTFTSIFLFVGMLIGVIVYTRLCRPWLVRRFRQRMTERALDLRASYRLEINDDGLVSEHNQLRKAADWSIVSELFRLRDYWVFLVYMEPWLVPVRFFKSVSEEQAFIRAALQQMTPEARARSPEAEKLAALSG